jgi:tetratricopeptide (TPR) repeat protein
MPIARQDLLQSALKAHRKGDIPTAERLYAKLLRAAPGDFNALHLLGVIRAQQRRLAEADRLIAKALEANISAEALNNHGSVLIELGREAEAISRLRRALLMKPGYGDAHFNLGNALRKSGQVEQACKSFAEAIIVMPGHVAARQNRSDCLRELDRHAEAILVMRQAIDIAPRNAQLHYNLGILLRDTADLEAARQSFDRAIALDPTMVAAYYNRVRSAKVEPGDGVLAAMERLAENSGAFSADDRAMLHFGLARAQDDTGRYDEAFENLLEANKAARSRVNYDTGAMERDVDRVKKIFTAEFIAGKGGAGSPSRLPIFVLGFPRSGTTLTEQILASHPTVRGAGELHFTNDLIRPETLGLAANLQFPEYVRELGSDSLARLGENYVERLHQIDSAAAHVTDKNPGNVRLLGFLHLILPEAKFIHVNRDPIDTCLSCFWQRFGPGAATFIYDLAELGRHYRQYQGLMDHWRRVLPPGAILEVQYENVVENLEPEVHRLLAYCGLDWDERCLSFHESERRVRTASVTQVRQPIYRSSLQRWRRYEKHLGPLMEALNLPSA